MSKPCSPCFCIWRRQPKHRRLNPYASLIAALDDRGDRRHAPCDRRMGEKLKGEFHMLSSLVREFNFGMIYSAGRFSSRPKSHLFQLHNLECNCMSIRTRGSVLRNFPASPRALHAVACACAQRVVSCLWRVLRIVEGAKSTNGIGGYKYPTYNVERIRFHFGEDGSLGHAKLHMTS
jgi:hypothetical protein